MIPVPTPAPLQFGVPEPGTTHRDRPAVFGIADDLRALLDDTVLDPWRRTHHSAEELAALEESLPRLRGLVVQSVMISFQGAVNRVIGKSLRRSA